MADFLMSNGLVLKNVHDAERCKGRPCVIHNPSEHHMSGFKLHWRDDRGIFERICPHGVGHPDPDQFAYWSSIGADAEAIHGCDGCCTEVAALLREAGKDEAFRNRMAESLAKDGYGRGRVDDGSDIRPDTSTFLG